MCIAILNKLNARDVSKNELLNCWENNYDGAGLLWSSGGELKSFKELKDFEVFYSMYQYARTESIGDVLIHFRISTHGEVNKTNTHPFIVNNELGFIHNGIIYEFGYEELFSDTYVFNRDVLQNLPSNFLENKGITTLINTIIDSSKLVFLDIQGNGTIFNERAGTWDDDNWFSNTSYKSINRYIDFGGTKVLKNKHHNYDKDFFESSFEDDEDIIFSNEGNEVCDSCLTASDYLIYNHSCNACLYEACSKYFK